MAKPTLDFITGQIFKQTLETLKRPSVPVANADAPVVAAEVVETVKPVIENAVNAEPWWRSRIYLGLIAAGVGAVAQHFGVQISGADLRLITDSVPELVQLFGSLLEIVGLLYAAYGRIVGASKPALGSK